jgi:hypothetical protein
MSVSGGGRIGKSIYGRLKSVHAFEPTVCPILVHGESGAEGNTVNTFSHYKFSSTHVI